jgi:hypothetical protein
MPKEEILTCNRRSAAAIATASTSELRSIILLCLFRNMKYDTRTARHAATDTAFVTITGTSDVSDGGQWSNSSSEAIIVSFVVSAILSTNVGDLVRIRRREGGEEGERQVGNIYCVVQWPRIFSTVRLKAQNMS